ncbi:Alpha-13/16-mannosyltransferase ALG2 [Meyerozyma sp. JA9]|nr:Alpha-13/16-mannosyltransferase ALG2 [Meyerozyma sp. JA9]
MDCKRIGFIHPDLGIGGAERLVVDAAVGLQERGHQVTIYTSHCDKSHCFDEVKNDTLSVKVYGDFFPIHMFRRFHIVFAMLRQLYLVLRLVLSAEILEYDYFVVDQLSFCVPLLTAFSRPEARILFYCHFPDQLLAGSGGVLKKAYRKPFNYIEEVTTGTSDVLVVNSNFTKSVFHKTFAHLADIDPTVIYPCVDVEGHNKAPTPATEVASQDVQKFFGANKFFLSLNRFERTKNVDLAIRSFAKLKHHVSDSKPRLVIAGGYDPRVAENVDYLRELTELCTHLELQSFTMRGKLVVMPPSTDILFLPSVSGPIKEALLQHAMLLLYTPTFEHFGIVPVESMLHKTPVLAANTGGPTETIVDYDGTNLSSATGFCRPTDPDTWGEVIVPYYTQYTDETRQKLGENGYVRVAAKFSRQEMAEQFSQSLTASTRVPKKTNFLVLVLGNVEWILLAVAVVLAFGKKYIVSMYHDS